MKVQVDRSLCAIDIGKPCHIERGAQTRMADRITTPDLPWFMVRIYVRNQFAEPTEPEVVVAAFKQQSVFSVTPITFESLDCDDNS